MLGFTNLFVRCKRGAVREQSNKPTSDSLSIRNVCNYKEIAGHGQGWSHSFTKVSKVKLLHSAARLSLLTEDTTHHGVKVLK